MITGMSEEYWNRQVKDLNLQIDNLTFERNMKQEEIERLNNIINEAIEYIEQPDNIQSVAFCKEDGEIMNLYKIDGAKSLELLDILKGSDKK